MFFFYFYYANVHIVIHYLGAETAEPAIGTTEEGTAEPFIGTTEEGTAPTGTVEAVTADDGTVETVESVTIDSNATEIAGNEATTIILSDVTNISLNDTDSGNDTLWTTTLGIDLYYPIVRWLVRME